MLREQRCVKHVGVGKNHVGGGLSLAAGCAGGVTVHNARNEIAAECASADHGPDDTELILR
jgi:hypothetical protein